MITRGGRHKKGQLAPKILNTSKNADLRLQPKTQASGLLKNFSLVDRSKLSLDLLLQNIAVLRAIKNDARSAAANARACLQLCSQKYENDEPRRRPLRFNAALSWPSLHRPKSRLQRKMRIFRVVAVCVVAVAAIVADVFTSYSSLELLFAHEAAETVPMLERHIQQETRRLEEIRQSADGVFRAARFSNFSASRRAWRPSFGRRLQTPTHSNFMCCSPNYTPLGRRLRRSLPRQRRQAVSRRSQPDEWRPTLSGATSAKAEARRLAGGDAD